MTQLELLIQTKEFLKLVISDNIENIHIKKGAKKLLDRIGKIKTCNINGKEFELKQLRRWINLYDIYNDTSGIKGFSRVSIIKEIRFMYDLSLRDAKEITDTILDTSI